MHPFLELRKLMSTRVRQRGVVQKVEGEKVYIATPKGTVIKDRNSGTNYQTGDAVVLVGGELAGREIPDRERPTFVL